MTPLVRVPAIDAALIGRVLDGGALGIIAPQVESAADAAGRGLLPPSAARRRSYAGGQAALGYRPAPGRGHGGPGRQRADGRHDRKPQRAGRGRGHRLGGRAGPAVHRRARPGGGPGPGRPMGPPGAAASAGPHPPGLPGCGQGAGPGGLAGQPALLRELAARRWAAWSRRARTWPACSRGHAARRRRACAARPAGANPSSSRTAARR